jgi:hypothetical protein
VEFRRLRSEFDFHFFYVSVCLASYIHPLAFVGSAHTYTVSLSLTPFISRTTHCIAILYSIDSGFFCFLSVVCRKLDSDLDPAGINKQ